MVRIWSRNTPNFGPDESLVVHRVGEAGWGCCPAAAEREGNNFKGSNDFYLKGKARCRQGQDLVLTVLHVPSSLDSGGGGYLQTGSSVRRVRHSVKETTHAMVQ